MNKTIRVRFAPSPTGELHLGGARTALFNYLFAKQNGGKFCLRIEDTDKARSKDKYVDQICDSLRWMGLHWDGPLMFQSRRKEEYRTAVKQLLNEERAYRCFCSTEELAEERTNAEKEGSFYGYSGKCSQLSDSEIKGKLNSAEPFCIRLKVSNSDNTSFVDEVYGTIEVDNKEIDDFIIQRTDGSATYNFVVVIDDSDMDITHVIRGEDHLTNTLKQIAVYEALSRNIPKFVHLPMILSSEGKRLSKRHGAVGVQTYREKGYLPEALVNFLSLLGWNPGDEQEIFSLEELVQEFSLSRIVKKAAVFDDQKFEWMSGQHLMKTSANDLLERIRKLDPEWKSNTIPDYLLAIVEVQQQRVKTIVDIMTQSDYFIEDPKNYDQKTSGKRWKDESVNTLMEKFLISLKSVEEWSEEAIEKSLRNLAESEELSPGKIIHPTRLALTGVPVGPSLYLLMEMLGEEICFRRIQAALNRLPLFEGEDSA
jgi:glutamyl-tRNA synthetase